MRRWGAGLAQLHRTTAGQAWLATRQHDRHDAAGQWAGPTTRAAFFRDRRIAPQLAFAARSGLAGRRCSVTASGLLAAIPGTARRARTGRVAPARRSLVGKRGAPCVGGEPAIFDPAVYFGDREADLAMTELFGGFGPDFYAAYRESWPLSEGHEARRDLYNLYHVLNHANLFGGGYVLQAGRMIGRLLGEVR